MAENPNFHNWRALLQTDADTVVPPSFGEVFESNTDIGYDGVIPPPASESATSYEIPPFVNGTAAFISPFESESEASIADNSTESYDNILDSTLTCATLQLHTTLFEQQQHEPHTLVPSSYKESSSHSSAASVLSEASDEQEPASKFPRI